MDCFVGLVSVSCIFILKLELMRLFQLLILLCCSFCSYSNWVFKPEISQPQNYFGIELINDSSFYSVGIIEDNFQGTIKGIVSFTTDFGETYNTLKETDNQRYNDVLFHDDKLFICGTSEFSGYIAYTVDNGTTWIETYTQQAGWWNDIVFVNDTLGFIGGGRQESTVLRTIDGGKSWDVFFNDNTGFPIQAIDFFDDKNGVIVTTFKIYKTTDGGFNWKDVTPQNYSSFSSVTITSGFQCYVTTMNGEILKSTDKGESWFERYPRGWGSNPEGEVVIEEVVFQGDVIGFAVGLVVGEDLIPRNFVLRTNNAGNDWEVVYSEYFPSGLRSLDISENLMIAANGYGAHLLSDNGGLDSKASAYIFGDNILCEGSLPYISFQFDGTPPFSVEYSYLGIQKQINNIEEYKYDEYIDGITSTTNFWINSFSDSEGSSTNIGGQASINKTNFTSGQILGGGIGCALEDSLLIHLNIQGCSPFEIVLYDGYNYDTIRNVQGNHYSFKASTDISRIIKIHSITNANGSKTTTSFTGEAVITSALPEIKMDSLELSACPMDTVNVSAYLLAGSLPFDLVYTIGGKQDTLFNVSDSLFNIPVLALSNSTLSLKKVLNGCGDFAIEAPLLYLNVFEYVVSPSDLVIDTYLNVTEVSWKDNSLNETSFHLYKEDVNQWNSKLEIIETFPPDTISYIDRFDTPEHDFKYKVCATNEESCEFCTPSLIYTILSSYQIVDTIGSGRGAYMGDFNNDAYDDVMIVYSNQLELYVNNQDGTFDTVSAPFIKEENTSIYDVSISDLNNDGWLDVFIPRRGYLYELRKPLLYYGGPNLTFTLDSTMYNSMEVLGTTSSTIDINNDGLLDIFIGTFYTDKNYMLLNDGNGVFIDTIISNLTDVVYDTYFPSWTDLNNDNKLDVILSSHEKNVFLENLGGNSFVTFEDKLYGTFYKYHSYSSGDYDNDGDLDLMSSYPGDGLFFYENKGGFRLQRDDSKYVSGIDRAEFVDFDNDGYLDIVTEDPDIKVLINHKGVFSPLFTLQKSDFVGNGLSISDIDLDGDMDLVTNGRVFKNMVGNHNNWIQFKLEGTLSNRSAIGAKIKVKTLIDNVYQWQLREVISKTSHSSGNSLTQHFGIENSEMVDSVIIEWPSGMIQEFVGLIGNTLHYIVEGVDQNMDLEPILGLNVRRLSLEVSELRWSKDLDFIGQEYIIERSVDSSFRELVVNYVVTENDSMYFDTTAYSGKDYFYRIKTILGNEVIVSNKAKLIHNITCNAEQQVFDKDTLTACHNAFISVADTFKTYRWSNGHSGNFAWIDSTSILTLEAIDALGCSVYDTIYVKIVEAPRPSLGSNIGLCPGDSMTLFGDSSITRLWYLNGIVLDSSVQITISKEGNYSLQQFIDGCEVSSNIVNVDIHDYPHASLKKHFDEVNCIPENRIYIGSGTDHFGNQNFLYLNGFLIDSIYSNLKSYFFDVDKNGVYQVISFIDYGSGCILSDTSNTVEVDFSKLPKLTFNNDTVSASIDVSEISLYNTVTQYRDEGDDFVVIPYSGYYRIDLTFEGGCNYDLDTSLCVKPKLLVEKDSLGIQNIDEGRYEYVWYHNDKVIGKGKDMFKIPIVEVDSGYYFVQMRSACQVNSDSLYVVATGVFSMDDQENVNPYPNPTFGEIYLPEHKKYEVLNNVGQIVLFGAGKSVDVSSLSPGGYFIRVEDLVYRFVKQ